MTTAAWLSNILNLGRDLAALAAGLSVLLAAAVLWTGTGVVSASLAASVALAAVGGVVTVALAGAISAVGVPWMWALAIISVLLAAAAFAAALGFGVRGLWFASMVFAGALCAGVLFTLFDRAGFSGPTGPLLTIAILCLVIAGGLGGAASLVDPDARKAKTARNLAGLFTPPNWFDCAYAALGGSGENEGRCADAPPTMLAAAPEPSTAITPDTHLLIATEPADDARAPKQPPMPSAPALLAAASTETPDFSHISDDMIKDAPQPATPIDIAADPAAVVNDDVPSDPEVPDQPREPAQVAAAAMPEKGVRFEPVEEQTRVLATATAASASAPIVDSAAVVPPRSHDRRRTAHICFPLLNAYAEQLCPDRRANSDTIEVSWSVPGGKAVAGIGDVECKLDPTAPSQITLYFALPADPSRRISRGDGTGEAIPLSVALYEAATRLFVSARTGRNVNHFFLATYFPNGSRLASAWATHSFGVERSDRLFNASSSSQTLEMLRRLKLELHSSRETLAEDVFSNGVAEALKDRPKQFRDFFGQSMLVTLVDTRSASEPSAKSIGRLSRLSKREKTPLFVITLADDGEPPEAYKELAEATGGVAYGAGDLAALSHAFERVILRARSFCAVRVSAPTSFFDIGSAEVRVKRQLLDGCSLTQVATLSCEEAEIREFVDDT